MVARRCALDTELEEDKRGGDSLSREGELRRIVVRDEKKRLGRKRKMVVKRGPTLRRVETTGAL